MLLLLISFVTAAAVVQPTEVSKQIFTNIRNLEVEESQHPGDADVESELAYNFFLVDQRRLFEETIKKAKIINARSEKLFYLDGRFQLEMQDDPRTAIKAFRKALELAPGDVKARCYLAKALLDIGQSGAAKTELTRVISSASYSWPFRTLAEIDLDFKAPGEALSAAQRAIGLDAQSMDNFLVAGKAYEALRQRENAISMYQKAEKLDPLADAPHYRLFKLYAERVETRVQSRTEAALFQKLKDEDTPRARKSVAGAQLPNGNPQARSREELNSFGFVMQAADPLSVVRRGEELLARFPGSEFREKVLELEFESFRQRNDYGAVKRVACKILAVNRWNASVLADSALMIANENDSAAFGLAEQYAGRALEAANATERRAGLSRADFFAWKENVLATVSSAQGLLALRRGDANAAVVSLTQATKLRPVPDGADFLRLGEAHLMRGEMQLAQTELRQAEALGPPVVAERARAQQPKEEVGRLDNGDVTRKTAQESIAECQNFVNLNPGLAKAHHNLGLAYYRAHDYVSAKNSLNRALALESNLVGTELFLGLSEFRLAEFQNSMRHLQGALRLEPHNREALFTLLQDQTALSEFNLATAKAAMQAFPGDAGLHYVIGLACLERIREISFSAKESGPDSPPSLWLRLRMAEGAGDNRVAEKLRPRLAGVPEPPAVLEYESVSSLLKQSFEAVLANEPDSKAAHSIEGYLLEATGKTDEAVSEYRKAGDHFAAGRLLAQNVQLDEAQSEFEAAVLTDPENDRAKADLGKLYVQKNEPDKATRILEALVKKYPEDAYAWADLGKAQGILGNSAAAIQCLQKALSLNPGLNQLHYQLALLYRKQGRGDLTSSELAQFQSDRKNNP